MWEVLGLNLSWDTGYPDKVFVVTLSTFMQMPGTYFDQVMTIYHSTI
jgi:hypothetical protein